MKKYVAVKFLDGYGKEYHFLTVLNDLKKGDLVVVDTRNGYSLAKVVKYITLPKVGIEINKYVVSVVNVKEHEQQVAVVERAEEIKAQMEKRTKELLDNKIFEELSKIDPTMNKLLFELNQIQGEI
jgi:hypothetical protein